MPIDFAPKKREMYGAVNQKCAATASGLSDIGISKFLLSPEFGPSVRRERILVMAHQRPAEYSQGGYLHKMPGRSPGRVWFSYNCSE
jgi:epoxyqueuosine reductase QueG